MTPTDLADVLDAIARQPAVPLRDIRGELRSAAQMLREMAEALRPFASAASPETDYYPDDEPLDDGFFYSEGRAFTHRDIRRARAALGSQP